MNTKTTLGLWLAAIWLLFALPFAAQADTGHQDTDLFMTNPNLESGGVNVLFVIDNSSNWSQSGTGTMERFEYVKEAVLELLTDDVVDLTAFNIGIMFGDHSGNTAGAYPYYAIQNITDPEGLVERVCGWERQGGKAGDFQICKDIGIEGGVNVQGTAAYAGSLHEAFLYLEGLEPRVGAFADLVDYDAFTPPQEQRTQYQPPASEENPCGSDTHIIFLSNGPPDQSDTQQMGTAARWVRDNYGMDLSTIAIDSRYEGNYVDEYARFLATRGIYTHAIDVDPGDSDQWQDHITLMRSTAHQGKGEYIQFDPSDPDQSLAEIIGNILNKIQAINTVFAASSLPVSVNNRGTHLNEVYMAMFRPDEAAKPQWVGNLKLYEFGRDFAGNVVLVDAKGNPAQNPLTGFLRSDAESYWTTDSNYWEFSPRGETQNPASDLPDGEIVEKGAVGQWLRENHAFRNLFTCVPDCTGGNLRFFDAANTSITAGMLNAANADERESIINWVHGDNNQPIPGAGDARPFIHGDVVHSSPTVINFNRSGDDSDIVVFYGANDGFLRGVKGGKDAGGDELWGYVPPEFLGEFKRQKDGDPVVNTPSVPGSSSAGNKPYLVDGNITSYVFDSNNDGRIVAADGDKAYIFATLRRGGRFIFALDVSTPETPSYMWTRGCYSDGSCDSGFDGIGETWSTPVVRRIHVNGESVIALIMGRGYDSVAEDQHPAGTRTLGQGIIILNAETGDVIWQTTVADHDLPAGVPAHVHGADMNYSFPGAISALDISRDGYTDRLYAGDTGGNVWRVDLLGDDPDNWGVYHLASLAGTGADERKFLFAPVVATGTDGNGPFHAVLIGSGDREKPFETSIENHFYMLKDRNTVGSGEGQALIELADLYDATENLIQDGATDDIRTDEANKLADAAGWYIRLGSGEKVVGPAEARAGSVFFATNQTAAMAVTDPDDPLYCASDLGIARTYVMSYEDATAVIERDGVPGLSRDDRSSQAGSHAGYLPPPTYALVCLDEDCNDLVEVVTLGPETIPVGDVELGERQREYWFKEVD